MRNFKSIATAAAICALASSGALAQGAGAGVDAELGADVELDNGAGVDGQAGIDAQVGADADADAEHDNGVGVDAEVGADAELGADVDAGVELPNGAGVAGEGAVGTDADAAVQMLGLTSVADAEAMIGMWVYANDDVILGEIDDVAVVDGEVRLTLVLVEPLDGPIERVHIYVDSVTEVDGTLVLDMDYDEFRNVADGTTEVDVDE